MDEVLSLFKKIKKGLRDDFRHKLELVLLLPSHKSFFMDLHIHPETRLDEIRSEFQRRFPNLDIAFFASAHKEGQGSPAADRIPGDFSAGEAGDSRRKGHLTVNGLTVVKDLEAAFDEEFGLFTQVLRKSGNVWLQTTHTDNKTLSELNAMGRENRSEIVESTEPEAFREQE
jgi:hypothetical protein